MNNADTMPWVPAAHAARLVPGAQVRIVLRPECPLYWTGDPDAFDMYDDDDTCQDYHRLDAHGATARIIEVRPGGPSWVKDAALRESADHHCFRVLMGDNRIMAYFTASDLEVLP